MKLDLHTHTCHSFDCETKVEDLIRAARDTALDAIAITDHDTMSAIGRAKKLNDKLVIIPGMEISTTKGTHIIGLFLKDEIISRDILDVIDEIHRQDGLVLLPHPFRTNSGLVYARDKLRLYNGEEMREIMSRIDLIEIINFNSTIDEKTECDRFFADYPNIPQIAGSDSHTTSNVGKAYVELDDVRSNSFNNIKQALLKSARTIRYEAYRAGSEAKLAEARIRPLKKTALTKAVEYVRRPIDRAYQAISGRIVSRTTDPGQDKIIKK